MSVDFKNLNSIQSYQKSAQLEFTAETQKSRQKTTEVTDPTQPVANAQTAKLSRQADIISHLFTQGSSQQVELFASKMNYQSAIEALNERLRADLGLAEDAIDPISQEKLNEQGGMEYWSPENTADRIVSGATAFLGGFQNAHPELQGEALMDKFMEVVGGGLIQGFEEAKSILGDLKVFDGQVESNYNQTYDLVQSGMQDFKQNFLDNLASS